MTIICADNTPIMLQTLKENAIRAFPHANIQTFLTAEAALSCAEKSAAMCFFVKSIRQDWKDFSC